MQLKCTYYIYFIQLYLSKSFFYVYSKCLCVESILHTEETQLYFEQIQLILLFFSCCLNRTKEVKIKCFKYFFYICFLNWEKQRKRRKLKNITQFNFDAWKVFKSTHKLIGIANISNKHKKHFNFNSCGYTYWIRVLWKSWFRDAKK